MADEPTPDSEVEQSAAEGEDKERKALLVLHDEALKRFDSCVQPAQEERALALRDRRFCTIAGAQWEGLWGEQFEHSIMVEINKTAQGVEKIIGDIRANRFIVDFRGADDGAVKDTSELLNGMFRADLYASAGQQAIDMAAEEAVQGGFGAWRLSNDWEDQYDPENDYQRIRFLAIPDADQRVFFDPNAKLYDKSDAKYAFVVTALSHEAYEEKYGENPASWPTGLFKTYYEWYTPSVVYIAEYYEIREKEGKLYVLRNKATGEEQRKWAADLDAGELDDLKQQGWEHVRTRQGKRKQVWKSVLSGMNVLEAPRRIAGCHIPIVPVYGKRWFIDNMERSRGHVRFAVDGNRALNAVVSKLIEIMALSPMERPIFTPEQVAGHEQSWSRGNIERHAYALLNPITGPDGNQLPAGPIGKVEPPQLPPVAVGLLQILSESIAELTTADDGADEVKANVSAEAMDLAATRTDAKSAIYMDNLRQSWQRCGVIYKSMADDVYVEEGRSVPVMSDDGQHDRKTLLEAYADEKGYRIRHDIGRGKYEVIADVTEATTTRRDKTVKTLVSVAEMAAPVDPQLAAASLNTALMNMDGEGMDDLQAWVRQRLVQQGVVKPTDEEKAQMQAAAQSQQPPSAQDQLTAAKVATEQTTAALNQAKTVLTMKQAEGEGAKTVSSIALAKLESVHAEQDQQAGHAQRRQQMVHAEQAHGLDMTQGVQAIHHAQQAHKLGLIERVRSMFAPKPQGGQ